MDLLPATADAAMPGAPMIPAPSATNQHDNKTDLKTDRLEIAIIWIDVLSFPLYLQPNMYMYYNNLAVFQVFSKVILSVF